MSAPDIVLILLVNTFVNLAPTQGTGSGQWSCTPSNDTCLFVVNDGVTTGAPYSRAQVHFDPSVSQEDNSYIVHP